MELEALQDGEEEYVHHGVVEPDYPEEAYSDDEGYQYDYEDYGEDEGEDRYQSDSDDESEHEDFGS